MCLDVCALVLVREVDGGLEFVEIGDGKSIAQPVNGDIKRACDYRTEGDLKVECGLYMRNKTSINPSLIIEAVA